jgi:hypothetical protein
MGQGGDGRGLCIEVYQMMMWIEKRALLAVYDLAWDWRWNGTLVIIDAAIAGWLCCVC